MEPHSRYVLNVLLVSALFLRCVNSPNEPDLCDSDLDCQNPIIGILSAVNRDSLSLTVRQLSGDMPVALNGTSYVIQSRHKDTPGNALAADYLQVRLESFGLDVTNQYFGESGRNVIAVQLGTRSQKETRIICAHYDCMPSGVLAPGADDNASGVAGVLEAARVLSSSSLRSSVMYALWDEEEQGLLGSSYYVTTIDTSIIKITGVVNLDMIGWDSNQDGLLQIDSSDKFGTNLLTDEIIAANLKYEIGLVPQRISGIGRSDHVPFLRAGYPAVLMIEDTSSDWNENYHTVDDRFQHLNTAFLHKAASLATVVLASLSGLQ